MSFFKNLGHYATLVIRDISKFGHLAQKAEPFVESSVELLYPPAAVITRLSHSALGFLVNAADQASGVVDGKVKLSVDLLEQDLADLKSLAAFFKSHAAANGVQLPEAPKS
ncbi:MAG: hypothetical protein LAP21_21355 [Acidobacteriia bacterium]|nr:hypothetical protein [Terriglobia bacterium]